MRVVTKRGRWSPLAAGLALLLGIAAGTVAQEDDKHLVEPAQARRAVTLIHARCAVCHTTDLIVQQRLPPDRWQVTVEKMMHWGADLSKDEAAALLQFVTARYHPGAPDHLPSIEEELALTAPAGGPSTASDGPLVGVPARGAEIFTRNCQACHGEGAMGGAGPKLARNKILKNEGVFWETVLHGRGPMPAWGAVLSQQEIADIHAWLATR
ncbi:MAG: c-type cytochrome [Nitrospira sp.]|nr:c-type cytochrome [Nitrospira sp.]